MINIFYELDFLLNKEQHYIDWIEKAIEEEKFELDEISYIFCSDEYLLEINKTHLNHDYYTDVISFDDSVGKILSGDIYISIDRVKENAVEFSETFTLELARVMMHGVLHLMGQKDKTPNEEKEMRAKENKYLARFKID